MISTLSISREPPEIRPVVVIVLEPVSIVPKPDVMLPEFSAPTVVAAVVTKLGIAVISSSKYAARSVTATCFIVPASLNTTRSASATVVEEAEVSPSIIFNSVAVLVTPSSMFNSAAVDVTFVPPISNVVRDTSPATVTSPLATVIKSVSSVCPIVEPLIRTSSISNDPPDINPVVVIVDEPLSIEPKPLVILPLFNAPTVVAAVVTRLGIAVISSSK